MVEEDNDNDGIIGLAALYIFQLNRVPPTLNRYNEIAFN